MESFFQLFVVLIGNQIGDGLAEVPKKTIACRRAFDDATAQYRKPWSRIVSAQLLELRQHVVSPILSSSLPAVVNHVADALFAHLICTHSVFVAVEVLLEVVLYEAMIELVHFQSGRFGRGRMIGDPLQRV